MSRIIPMLILLNMLMPIAQNIYDGLALFVNEISFLARDKEIILSSYSFAMHLAAFGYPKRMDISITNVVSFGILNALDSILDNPKDKLYTKFEFISISVISK